MDIEDLERFVEPRKESSPIDRADTNLLKSLLVKRDEEKIHRLVVKRLKGITWKKQIFLHQALRCLE